MPSFRKFRMVVLLGIVILNFHFNISAQSHKALKQEELDQKPVYYLMDEALKNPEDVYKLDLGSQNLKEIPKEIEKLKYLQSLSLGVHYGSKLGYPENNLSLLPEELKELKYLEKIDLSDNPNLDLRQTFLTLSSLPNLKTLILNADFSEQPHQELPPEIGLLKQLEFLSFRSHYFKTLPDEIGNLKNLKVLDLSISSDFALDREGLSDLPDSIQNLNKLQSLELDGNSIEATVQKKIKKLLPKTKINF